jgi:hypothetical protein
MTKILAIVEQDARNNAQYRSTTAVSELVEAINTHLESKMLDQVRKSPFIPSWQMRVVMCQLLKNCPYVLGG